MSAPQNTLAVIFDFDDTLTDDSTTKLLEEYQIDAKDFWQSHAKMIGEAQWNPTLAYLKLLLDNIGPQKPLGSLTNQRLREFGEKLEFYEGLPELFGDLRAIMDEHPASHPAIEFYIISGGLEEVIKGSAIAKYFTGIWGCRFAEEDGVIKHIMNAISFTEKTRYIFEINKGLNLGVPQPYAVNKEFKKEERRVPFENMIYIGDGLTDVPCFSLLNVSGGQGFGVFDPAKKDSPKKVWEGLVVPNRVKTTNSPRYAKNQDLGALLRVAVNEICVQIDLRTQRAS